MALSDIFIEVKILCELWESSLAFAQRMILHKTYTKLESLSYN